MIVVINNGEDIDIESSSLDDEHSNKIKIISNRIGCTPEKYDKN